MLDEVGDAASYDFEPDSDLSVLLQAGDVVIGAPLEVGDLRSAHSRNALVETRTGREFTQSGALHVEAAAQGLLAHGDKRVVLASEFDLEGLAVRGDGLLHAFVGVGNLRVVNDREAPLLHASRLTAG
jgi:hypothetical protein